MKFISHLLLLVFFIVSGCSTQKDNFERYVWSRHVVDYDSNYEEKEIDRIVIRGDSIDRFYGWRDSSQFVPFIKTDSTIIVKQLWNDSVYYDTMLYDFKNIIEIPILLLKTEDRFSLLEYEDKIIILFSNTTDDFFTETSNFYPDVSFAIKGYDIGDSINFDDIENVEETDDWDCPGLISGNIIGDENVVFDIINKQIIYRITRKGIEREQVGSIIEVINSKLKIEPKVSKDNYNSTISYQWKYEGFDIQLDDRSMYNIYMQMADNEQDEWKRSIILSMAAGEISKMNEYTLEYNNAVRQSIMRQQYSNKKVSSIIE